MHIALLALFLVSTLADNMRCQRIITRLTKGPPTNTLTGVVDINYQRWTATGLWTQTQITNSVISGTNWFSQKFGLQFPNTCSGLAFGINSNFPCNSISYLMPLSNGYNITGRPDYIASDTLYPNRASLSNPRVAMDFGLVVYFLASGTFTSGQYAGANYYAGDILVYAENAMVTQDSSKWFNSDGTVNSGSVEFNTYLPHETVKQPSSQWSGAQQAGWVEYINPVYGSGIATVHVTSEKEWPSGNMIMRGTQVIRFNCVGV